MNNDVSNKNGVSGGATLDSCLLLTLAVQYSLFTSNHPAKHVAVHENVAHVWFGECGNIYVVWYA